VPDDPHGLYGAFQVAPVRAGLVVVLACKTAAVSKTAAASGTLGGGFSVVSVALVRHGIATGRAKLLEFIQRPACVANIFTLDTHLGLYLIMVKFKKKPNLTQITRTYPLDEYSVIFGTRKVSVPPN
jgi:hypothetical protein